jgi:cytochrome P450
MHRASDSERRSAPPAQRRAPGPPGAPLLGSALEIQRQGQLHFYLENWRTYGDVVRFRLGPFVAHILAHPDHIQHVLVNNAQNYHKGPSYAKVRPVLGYGLLTSEGDLWRRQRRLMQPPFTHRSVLQFASPIIAAVDDMLARWQSAAAEGAILVINEEMARLTLTVIGQTIFSADLGAVIQTILTASVEVTSIVNRRLASFVDVPLALPTPTNRRFTRAIHSFDTVVYPLIAARRRQHGEPPDLLDKLLAVRDDETGRPMSDRQIRDEVLIMLFAGHETSALALTWIWYLLAQHPQVEHKLHAELAAVLGGRAPVAEDLAALPYTRMVVEESLRLYPPVWTFPRAAIADDAIGGYHIPAGSLIFPCQYLTHRHPELWECPERFDPERFTLERSANRARYAYYPFGAGPRSCIGSHFALVELCLVLATVAQRYRLVLRPGPPIEPISRVTLHPSRDILMTLEAR